MVDAAKLLGVDIMTLHFECTYGQDRVEEIAKATSPARSKSWRRTSRPQDFGDPVFAPYAMRDVNGVKVAIIGQAFPYTPIANPALHRSPTGPSASRKTPCRPSSTKRARKGAPVVVVLSHNGMDVDLKMASRVSGVDAILGGHTHDGMPRPTIVSNPGGKTLVTNAGSNGKFLGVLDLDVQDGKVADYRYRLLPVFANLLPADPEMDALIQKARAPFEAKLVGKARRQRGPALPARQFQRQFRPVDPRRADRGEGRGDRLLARASGGARRSCPARRSPWRTCSTRPRSPIPT